MTNLIKDETYEPTATDMQFHFITYVFIDKRVTIMIHPDNRTRIVPKLEAAVRDRAKSTRILRKFKQYIVLAQEDIDTVMYFKGKPVHNTHITPTPAQVKKGIPTAAMTKKERNTVKSDKKVVVARVIAENSGADTATLVAAARKIDSTVSYANFRYLVVKALENVA
jgi:hypothetical protein